MKVFKKILCITISLVLFLMVSSCFGCQKNYELVESGDFICIKYKRKDKDKLYYFELSEEGKQKEVLVLPKIINGKKFIIIDRFIDTYHSKQTPRYDYANHTFYFESYNIKKIYIEADMDEVYSNLGIRRNIALSCGERKLLNLQKIISAECDFYVMLDWKMSWGNIKAIVNDYVFNTAFYTYYNRDENGFMKYSRIEYFESGLFKKANLQFMYNYENAPNEGYYWVDDIENGEKLEIMPTNPTREGYTFGGWYADKECLTEFDFEQTFKNGDYTPWTYPDNFTTYVYAKWIEI